MRKILLVAEDGRMAGENQLIADASFDYRVETMKIWLFHILKFLLSLNGRRIFSYRKCVKFLVIFHSANLKLAMLDTPVSSFISMSWPECAL